MIGKIRIWRSVKHEKNETNESKKKKGQENNKILFFSSESRHIMSWCEWTGVTLNEDSKGVKRQTGESKKAKEYLTKKELKSEKRRS